MSQRNKKDRNFVSIISNFSFDYILQNFWYAAKKMPLKNELL